MKQPRLSLALSLCLYCAGVQADEQVRLDYLLHCSGCHLPSGEGAEGVRGLNELGPIVARPGGRAYLVQVPDASQTPITNADLTRITNWVLKEFNSPTLPQGFQPLTEDEVAKARKVTLLDPRKRRAEILSYSR